MSNDLQKIALSKSHLQWYAESINNLYKMFYDFTEKANDHIINDSAKLPFLNSDDVLFLKRFSNKLELLAKENPVNN